MVAQHYQKTDSGMQALLSALDEQITSMKNAQNTVEGIGQDISAHYTADSSRQYLGRIEEWLSTYNTVIRQVWSVTDSLGVANRVLDSSNQQALQQASGWSPGMRYEVAMPPGVHGAFEPLQLTSDQVFTTMNGQ